MATPLSPSETATGLTRGQATKLIEMAEHGLIKSPVFHGVSTARVDEFVKTVGPELRDAYVELVERRFQAFVGCHRIPVNYDEQDAIAKAITENRFGSKGVHIDLAKIPLGGKGQAVEEVHEVHFGKIMCNRDLPAALKAEGQQRGFKFASPLASLRYAQKFPKKQLEQPRGILFYDTDGQLCFLYLNERGGKRHLHVHRTHPDGYWYENVRFLAVPESEPLAA
jgi:hypothetical protein